MTYNLKPKTYIFGNWKMYLGFDESNILVHALLQQKYVADNMCIAIFPSALAIREVAMAAQDTPIAVGAQNVNWNPKGAYTGEVSAHMFKDVGCTYALIGHSERRHIFGESNEDVRKKLEACVDVGLIPELCIGETKEDREAGKTQYRLKKQLMKALDGLDMRGGQLIIAYEPVWAIGTGDACLPDDARDVIGWIREEVKLYQSGIVPVLYGGSVSGDNVVSYVSQTEIDGVLVGGASSTYDTFSTLISRVISK